MFHPLVTLELRADPPVGHLLGAVAAFHFEAKFTVPLSVLYDITHYMPCWTAPQFRRCCSSNLSDGSVMWLSANRATSRVDSCSTSASHSVVSAVGGLLQTRFTPGLLLSHLSDSPRPPPPPSVFAPRASPAPVEPTRLSQWAGPGPSSFMLPSRPTEVPIRIVGARRLGGPVPLKESVTQGKVSASSAVHTMATD